MNDVNLSPGSSTRPTSDPGREPVFTGVQHQGSPNRGPAGGWRAFSSKPVKWTIRRFYWLTRRTRPFLQLWRHGSDFLYTKNFAMGRSDCIYFSTQRIPRGRDRIFPTQRMGAMRQKMAIFKEGNSVCRVPFFQELSFYIQKELTNDFFLGGTIFPDKF